MYLQAIYLIKRQTGMEKNEKLYPENIFYSIYLLVNVAGSPAKITR